MTSKVKHPKRPTKHRGFIDTRYQARMHDDQASRMQEEIAAGRLRLMHHFSADELVELQAKVEVWVATGAGLSGVYATQSIGEGSRNAD
jgi:hypothetical protein